LICPLEEPLEYVHVFLNLPLVFSSTANPDLTFCSKLASPKDETLVDALVSRLAEESIDVFISCDSSKKDLKSEIEKVKDECPLDLGMVGEISSINYDEETDEVVMTMTINKDLPLKLSALKQLKNTMKRTVLGNMAKSE